MVNINTLAYFYLFSLTYFPSTDGSSSYIEGLSFGFDTGIQDLPVATFECKNLLSAHSQPDITTKLIQSEVEKGFLSGPFDTMPFDIYRVNPVGVAEGNYTPKRKG